MTGVDSNHAGSCDILYWAVPDNEHTFPWKSKMALTLKISTRYPKDRLKFPLQKQLLLRSEEPFIGLGGLGHSGWSGQYFDSKQIKIALAWAI